MAAGAAAESPAQGEGAAAGRLVLLVTSPRVAPGLLTLRAWDTLRGAAAVLVEPGGHPQLDALTGAGIRWQAAAPEPAGERARALAGFARSATGPVVWLASGDGDEDLVRALSEVAAGGQGPEIEVLDGSYDLPGARLLDLVATMDTLRTGCPWDAKQTHTSLAPHLIEESYEALEALESGTAQALREELGDVLLQVVFHARVAAERGDGTGYTIDDVADGIVSKLVRRHPHVFGSVTVSGADEVKANWDAIKAAEREAASGAPSSVLDGVPFGQPALALTAQLQRRATRGGVPAELSDLTVPAPDAVRAPDGAEPAPDGAEPAPGGAEGERGSGDPGSDLGAELFSLVARAREAGLDPELELRAAARRYRDRVRAWERGTSS
jgi:XTP/dITP diphosphohydrolase